MDLMGFYRELRRDLQPFIDNTTVDVYASPGWPNRAAWQTRRLPLPDAARPAVSLIASVRDERDNIEAWFASLCAQTRLPDEIVIVDAGSTDGTFETLRELASRSPVPVRILQEPNANIARGRNRAIEVAHGPIIACTDGGCEVSPGWLAAITGPFVSDAPPEVVAGYYTAICGNDVQRAMAPYLTPDVSWIDPAQFLPSGRSVAFHKDAWEAIGGFPEWLTLTAEDTLFDVALKRRAARWGFVPEAVVGWHPRETIKQLFDQVRSYARGDGEAGLFPDRYWGHIRRTLTVHLATALMVVCLALAAWNARASWLLGAASGLAWLAWQIRRMTLRDSNLSGTEKSKAFVLSAAVGYTLMFAQALGFLEGVRLRTKKASRRSTDGAMRIGIDVRYLSHGLMGGVHTYVSNLLPQLFDVAGDHQFFLYADRKCPLELASLPPHVTVRFLPWKSFFSSLINDFALRHQMASDALDIVHFPADYGWAPRGARWIVTVHDALNLHPLGQRLRGLADGNLRTFGDAAMALYLHAWTRFAARRADLVVTISEHSKQEIARYGRIDPERIVVVPHGVPSDARRSAAPAADVRARLGLAHPFVLADALKNPRLLVGAWQRLDATIRERYEIVFFSRHPNPLPAVHEAVAARLARLFVRPPRTDLIALFGAAEAFVFPSWTEGFGLPVLEAMACGAPVIASDRGALPEVAGGAAILVGCDDTAGLARHLERVLTDPAEAERLRQLGFARAARFSWRDAAERTLHAYRRALGHAAAGRETKRTTCVSS